MKSKKAKPEPKKKGKETKARTSRIPNEMIPQMFPPPPNEITPEPARHSHLRSFLESIAANEMNDIEVISSIFQLTGFDKLALSLLHDEMIRHFGKMHRDKSALLMAYTNTTFAYHYISAKIEGLEMNLFHTDKLLLNQVALICYYNKRHVSSYQVAEQIAKEYGHKSRKLFDEYNKFKKTDERHEWAKDHFDQFKAIRPHLNDYDGILKYVDDLEITSKSKPKASR